MLSQLQRGTGVRGSPSHCLADVGRKTRPDIWRMPNRNLMLCRSLPQCLFNCNRCMSTMVILLFAGSQWFPIMQISTQRVYKFNILFNSSSVLACFGCHCQTLFMQFYIYFMETGKVNGACFNIMAFQFESSLLSFAQLLEQTK